MILVDNCVISSLIKIDRLELLKHFEGVTTTSGVIEEAFNSEITKIIKSLSNALDNWIEVEKITDNMRVLKIQNRYPSLSWVDSEIIILCLEKEAVLFTDDRRLIQIAEKEFGIETYDLCEILVGLKKKDLLLIDDIEDIVEKLEKKDRYIFSEEDLKMLRG